MPRSRIEFVARSLLERKDFLPFGFHVRDCPAAFPCFVPRLVQAADVGLSVIGPLALGVGMMHQTHEARAASRRGPFKHLLVAVRIAERENRTLSDETVDAHRFSGTIVESIELA